MNQYEPIIIGIQGGEYNIMYFKRSPFQFTNGLKVANSFINQIRIVERDLLLNMKAYISPHRGAFDKQEIINNTL